MKNIHANNFQSQINACEIDLVCIQIYIQIIKKTDRIGNTFRSYELTFNIKTYFVIFLELLPLLNFK